MRKKSAKELSKKVCKKSCKKLGENVRKKQHGTWQEII